MKRRETKTRTSLIALTLCLTGYVILSSKSGNGENSLNNSELLSNFESVKIGNQIWMTNNLDISTFRNGDSIHEARSVSEWRIARDEKKPAWCYYEYNAGYSKRYGKLYNWYAISDRRGLAPRGWHIPGYKEWLELENYLGGRDSTGVKMKSKEGWYKDGIWNPGNGTNESGFNALPGGYCTSNGSFGGLHEEAGFWTSGQVDKIYCRGRKLTTNSNYLSNFQDFKDNGHSIRCIKDK